MKLSIVTINFNNATGLKKTMESVRAQSWKDFEYLVIDGGSSDGSVELIRNFQEHITYWVSERDSGVYNAMNKGIDQAAGDYILFLNSGDYLIGPDVLKACFETFAVDTDLVYGDLMIEQDGKLLYRKEYPGKLSFSYFFNDESLPHPATFIRRKLFDTVGHYNESFKIVSDWEFWLKAIFLQNASYKRITVPVSVFNLEGISSKSENQQAVLAEKNKVYATYFPNIIDDYRSFRKHELRNKSLKAFLKANWVRKIFRKLVYAKQ